MGRKEQAMASRAHLLEVARECFARDGYERTTVADILRRAGMARGALYHYFPGGKQDLFEAVFDTVNEEFHRKRDAGSRLSSPLARLRGGIRAFLELCTRDDFARIALMDAPRLIPEQARLGSSYELMRLQLEEARRAGETRKANNDVVAMALYGAIRSAGEYVTRSSDRPRAAATAARSIELLLDGLKAR